MLDEQALLRGVQRGERQAQKAFYQHFKGKMMGVCRRYTRRQDEAEDLFQEAMVRVFEQISTLRQAGALSAWVRQTVIRTAINHYHREARHQHPEPEPDTPGSDETQVLTAMTTEELLGLINQLPDGYRLVFNLFVIDQYTHQEIADLLKISENTSKSQLARARQWLRRELLKRGISHYESY